MQIELNPQGPHSPDYTRDVATAAAEAVRVLNYATADADGLAYPGDVYDVLGMLTAAARGLPQTLQQLTEWLAAETAAGRIGQDAGGAYADANEAAADVSSRLLSAAAAAGVLADHLAAAQSAAAGTSDPGQTAPAIAERLPCVAARSYTDRGPTRRPDSEPHARPRRGWRRGQGSPTLASRSPLVVDAAGMRGIPARRDRP